MRVIITQSIVVLSIILIGCGSGSFTGLSNKGQDQNSAISDDQLQDGPIIQSGEGEPQEGEGEGEGEGEDEKLEGAILINNDDSATEDNNVTISASYTSLTTEFCLTADIALNNCDWMPVVATTTLQLADIVGEKTIYAKFKDALGNEIGGDGGIKDSILYNPQIKNMFVSIDSGSNKTNSVYDKKLSIEAKYASKIRVCNEESESCLDYDFNDSKTIFDWKLKDGILSPTKKVKISFANEYREFGVFEAQDTITYEPLPALVKDWQTPMKKSYETNYLQPTNKIDILLVIDNSISMAEEQSLLSGALTVLKAGLNAAHLDDYHIGVVTTTWETTYCKPFGPPDAKCTIDEKAQYGNFCNPASQIGDLKCGGGTVNGDCRCQGWPVEGGANLQSYNYNGGPYYFVSKDDPESIFQELIKVGEGGHYLESGIKVANEFLHNVGTKNRQNPNGEYFYREDAALAVVYFSDMIDSSNVCYEFNDAGEPIIRPSQRLVPGAVPEDLVCPAEFTQYSDIEEWVYNQFKSFVDTYKKGKFAMFSISPLDDGTSDCADKESIFDTRYNTLAEMFTQGGSHNICSLTFASIQNIISSITAQLSDIKVKFNIREAADYKNSRPAENDVSVLVNGEEQQSGVDFEYFGPGGYPYLNEPYILFNEPPVELSTIIINYKDTSVRTLSLGYSGGVVEDSIVVRLANGNTGKLGGDCEKITTWPETFANFYYDENLNGIVINTGFSIPANKCIKVEYFVDGKYY